VYKNNIPPGLEQCEGISISIEQSANILDTLLLKLQELLEHSKPLRLEKFV